MTNLDCIRAVLREHRIFYEEYEHPAVHTMRECLSLPFLDLETMYCKNVVLCNRQQTDFYLMLLQPDTAFRTAVVSKLLGVSRLSFAPADALPGLLMVQSGAVSPLGLFFDKDRKVKLCYERALRLCRKYAVHPCDNTRTMIFAHDAFWNRLLPLLCHQPIELELAEMDGVSPGHSIL